MPAFGTGYQVDQIRLNPLSGTINNRILILGASGMLGSALFRFLQSEDQEVYGTVRDSHWANYFKPEEQSRLISGINVLNEIELLRAFRVARPHLVVNCIGIIKQQSASKDPLQALSVNSLLPHRLSALCATVGARLLLISTDCVFRGDRGNYSEKDEPDATDLYGKSKELGEISGEDHVLTLRTSIVGHELNSNYSLVDWFLSQNGPVPGYTGAIFSGLPTVEVGNVINDVILPDAGLSGLHHLSSNAISKHDFLKLVATEYQIKSEIIPSEELKIDRSLNSAAFRALTGYEPPDWPELVKKMHQFQLDRGFPNVQ